MEHVAIEGGWIFRDNLAPFVYFIARQAEYDLLPDEMQAIRFGVDASDHERDCWYDYELAGKSRVRLWLAVDAGSSVMFWRAESPPALRAAIEPAADIMSEYQLAGGPR